MKFDFEALKPRIKEAARKAFIELTSKHKDVYAFALYSDEGAMTICPSTNTLEHLSEYEGKDDYVYYKFEPFEWKYEMAGAEEDFNELSKIVREYIWDVEDDDVFDAFQQKLYGTCIEVLKELKQENFFNKTAGRDIFLIFSVSEYEFENEQLAEMITQLNDNDYRDEYLAWMQTWG